MANERNEPRGILPALSERLAMEGRLTRIESQLGEMRVDVETKHKENRASIHRLGNQQQEMVDRNNEKNVDLAELLGQLKSLPAAIDRLTGKFELRCKDIENNVFDLQVKMAKAMGWAAAAGSISSAAFEIVHMLVRGH